MHILLSIPFAGRTGSRVDKSLVSECTRLTALSIDSNKIIAFTLIMKEISGTGTPRDQI